MSTTPPKTHFFEWGWKSPEITVFWKRPKTPKTGVSGGGPEKGPRNWVPPTPTPGGVGKPRKTPPRGGRGMLFYRLNPLVLEVSGDPPGGGVFGVPRRGPENTLSGGGVEK